MNDVVDKVIDRDFPIIQEEQTLAATTPLSKCYNPHSMYFEIYTGGEVINKSVIEQITNMDNSEQHYRQAIRTHTTSRADQV